MANILFINASESRHGDTDCLGAKLLQGEELCAGQPGRLSDQSVLYRDQLRQEPGVTG